MPSGAVFLKIEEYLLEGVWNSIVEISECAQ